MAEHIYTKEFLQSIETIYGAKNLFTPVLGEVLDAKDGVDPSSTYFTIHQAPTPVALNTYSTDANTGMGTGTSKSSRFGDAHENIYKSVDVKYAGTFAFNEGIDNTTSNISYDKARADIMEMKSLQLVRKFNELTMKELSTAAKVTESGESGELMTQIPDLFDKAFALMKNNDVYVDLYAYVTPQVYTKIVALPEVTTGKGANVNIGSNEVVDYKGFKVVCTPEDIMANEIIVFTPASVGRGFLGVHVFRELTEVEDFYGVLLQGLMKYGVYVGEENKKVIMKVTKTDVYSLEKPEV